MSNDPACGSNAGYQRHYRAGQTACDACLAAHRAYTRENVRSWRQRTGKSRREIVPVQLPGRCVPGLGWPV